MSVLRRYTRAAWLATKLSIKWKGYSLGLACKYWKMVLKELWVSITLLIMVAIPTYGAEVSLGYPMHSDGSLSAKYALGVSHEWLWLSYESIRVRQVGEAGCFAELWGFGIQKEFNDWTVRVGYYRPFLTRTDNFNEAIRLQLNQDLADSTGQHFEYERLDYRLEDGLGVEVRWNHVLGEYRGFLWGLGISGRYLKLEEWFYGYRDDWDAVGIWHQIPGHRDFSRITALLFFRWR